MKKAIQYHLLLTYRIKGSFRENLELWDFPLDYQVWEVFNKVFNNCLLKKLGYE